MVAASTWLRQARFDRDALAGVTPLVDFLRTTRTHAPCGSDAQHAQVFSRAHTSHQEATAGKGGQAAAGKGGQASGSAASSAPTEGHAASVGAELSASNDPGGRPREMPPELFWEF